MEQLETSFLFGPRATWVADSIALSGVSTSEETPGSDDVLAQFEKDYSVDIAAIIGASILDSAKSLIADIAGKTGA